MKKEVLEWLRLKEQIAHKRTELIKEAEKNAVRVQQIATEGIKNMEDIVFYLEINREELMKVNYEAVNNNNQLLYIESTAIIRFIDNTLSLIKPATEQKNKKVIEEYYGYQ
ncbi:MAG: hypothetical protein QIT46_gp03 [Methanophagales virus PBV305]|uniref:Uncharacterized protein n=1 Tax=Methanophagales virus PBV305 TaxID=3071310 RepID=A0AA46TDU0_9VIRU|nr:MAG: hypothetical protein QIT46_gp03 [Methanophagales virus PBV305]UYL65055.1 MAG: hypothetical protein HJKPNNFO_00003 [Methanophagales virus PBV305]